MSKKKRKGGWAGREEEMEEEMVEGIRSAGRQEKKWQRRWKRWTIKEENWMQ